MKFIELHFTDGNPIIINVDHIATVNIDKSGGTKNTIISLSTGENSYFSVVESVSTVMARIYNT